jgi:hypothetical protein
VNRAAVRLIMTGMLAAVGASRGVAGVPEPQALEVTATPARSAFSLHEPVLITLRFTNGSKEPLSFQLARTPAGTLFFMVLTITRPDGIQVVRSLPDEPDEIFRLGDIALAPGASTTLDGQVLNDWHDFHQLGEYRVVASIPITPAGQLTSRTHPPVRTAFTIMITPRNAGSLKETCSKLAAKASLGELQAAEASHALRFATDSECLPSLESALFHELAPFEVLDGLAGVGTPEAAAAVARAWDRLGDYQRAHALRRFTASGAGEVLRAALKNAGLDPGH